MTSVRIPGSWGPQHPVRRLRRQHVEQFAGYEGLEIHGAAVYDLRPRREERKWYG